MGLSFRQRAAYHTWLSLHEGGYTQRFLRTALKSDEKDWHTMKTKITPQHCLSRLYVFTTISVVRAAGFEHFVSFSKRIFEALAAG